jgi:TolB-like protein
MYRLKCLQLQWVVFLCCLYPALCSAGMFSKDQFTREITSTPAGAKISYSLKDDDKWTPVGTGTAPISDKFDEDKYPAGYYRAELEGYKPEKKLQATPAKPGNIKLSFVLQPITTIRLSITSKPGDAMILFGTNKNNISKQLGSTPYKESKTDAGSEEKPYWEKGYYKALLTGYRPKVIATEQKSENVELNFDLEPVPQLPVPPEIEYPDARTVAFKPVFVDAFKNPDYEISYTTPMAIMPFKDNSGKDMGSTIADSLVLKLQRKGFVVLEREYVDKAISDLNSPPAEAVKASSLPAPSAAGDNETLAGGAPEAATAAPRASEPPPVRRASTGIDLIKQLSGPLKTRVFLIGTVTEYNSGKEDVSVIPSIPAKEKERYQKEHDAYLDYFKSENMARPQTPKTLQEWDLEFSSKARTASVNVARVAITAKLLDVSTGKAIWTGMVNISENGLQKALNKVLDSIADSIADKGEGTGEGKQK